MSKINKVTEKSILTMHRHGFSYGTIAKMVGCSRQNVHRIVKLKSRPLFRIVIFNYEFLIKKHNKYVQGL